MLRCYRFCCLSTSLSGRFLKVCFLVEFLCLRSMKFYSICYDFRDMIILWRYDCAK